MSGADLRERDGEGASPATGGPRIGRQDTACHRAKRQALSVSNSATRSRPRWNPRLHELCQAVSGNKFIVVGHTEQRLDVDLVLRAFGRPSEQLEHKQRTRACDRQRDTWEHLDDIGLLSELGLNARRREQQVDHSYRVQIARCRETDGGQAFDSFLLDDGIDLPSPCGKLTHQRLGSGVVGNSDREIHISGEAGLCPHRDRQAADEREGDSPSLSAELMRSSAAPSSVTTEIWR